MISMYSTIVLQLDSRIKQYGMYLALCLLGIVESLIQALEHCLYSCQYYSMYLQVSAALQRMTQEIDFYAFSDH